VSTIGSEALVPLKRLLFFLILHSGVLSVRMVFRRSVPRVVPDRLKRRHRLRSGIAPKRDLADG